MTAPALATAARIEALLKSFPSNRWTDKDAWETRLRELQVLILNEGGSWKNDWQGGRVSLLGYKATSTEGLTGAARNWITQVRAKSGAAA